MSERGAAFEGSGGGWEALARQAARHGEAEVALVDLQRLLTFRLDGAAYALPVERVREIVRIRPITPIPRVPEEVRGVISLRGEILQVVDLRRRLGLELLEPGRSSRVIVVHDGDGRVAGLLVDAVTEVISVDEDQMRPAAGEARSVQALYARDEEFVSLVDIERVLDIDAEQ